MFFENCRWKPPFQSNVISPSDGCFAGQSPHRSEIFLVIVISETGSEMDGYWKSHCAIVLGTMASQNSLISCNYNTVHTRNLSASSGHF